MSNITTNIANMEKPQNTFYATHEIKFTLKGRLMLLLGARAVVDTTTVVGKDGELLHSGAITHVKFKSREL